MGTPRPTGNVLWAGPTACNVYPFSQTATFFAFYIDNVSIAAAAAAHTVLFGRVPMLPVVVFLESLLLVGGSLLEEGFTGQLSAQRGVGWTMLDGGVAVSKIPEVMNVTRGKESASGKRVDGRVTPLPMC